MKSRVECDRSLSGLTTFRTGGKVRYFSRPQAAGEIGSLINRSLENGIPVKFLGGGSNIIIVSDPVEELVVQLRASDIASVEFDGERVIAGAAARTADLVRAAAEQGLGGLEFMVGVPGTVGGAFASCASTRGGNFFDAVKEVQTVGLDGELAWHKPGNLGDDRAVMACKLRLQIGDACAIRERMEAEKEYRSRTQPYNEITAGCVFRNPPGESAGELIEKAGLKGCRVGGAEVSSVHANFIINRGTASGSDVLKLIDLIKETVRNERGLTLELEVDIW